MQRFIFLPMFVANCIYQLRYICGHKKFDELFRHLGIYQFIYMIIKNLFSFIFPFIGSNNFMLSFPLVFQTHNNTLIYYTTSFKVNDFLFCPFYLLLSSFSRKGALIPLLIYHQLFIQALAFVIKIIIEKQKKNVDFYTVFYI